MELYGVSFVQAVDKTYDSQFANLLRDGGREHRRV